MSKIAWKKQAPLVIGFLLTLGHSAISQTLLDPKNCPPGCNCGMTVNCLWASRNMANDKITIKKSIKVDDLDSVIADLEKLKATNLAKR